MKQATLLIGILCLWFNSYSQMTGWQAAWTYQQYPMGQTAAIDIVRDRADNLYVLSIVNDSFYRHLQSAALLKYSPTGRLIWRKDFTAYGIRDISVYNLEIDSQDRLYIAGNYGAYYRPTPPATNINLLIDTVVSADTTLNGLNAFLFCLDTSGHRTWSKFLSNDSAASIISLSVNKAGDIALIGSYPDTFRLGGLMVTQPPGGQLRYFITRLDASGNVQTLRGAYRNEGLAGCYINNRKEIFVTGTFSGWTQFDSIRLNSQSTGAVITTGFFVKFDSSGKAKWLKGIYGHLPQSGPSVYGNVGMYTILEQLNGNLLVIGTYNFCTLTTSDGAFSLPFSDQDASFIVCFDSLGNPVWLKGTWPGRGMSGLAGLASDATNNIYCSGSAYDPASFGTDTVTWGGASTGTDALLYKLNPSGKLLWARFAGGSYHDGGSVTVLSADGSSVYSAGASQSPDSISFGSFSRPTAGVFTLFVAKTGTAPLRVESLPQTAAFPVTLYPNPAGETLTAKLPEKLLLREVLVVDAAGQVRLQMSAPPAHGSEVRLPVGLLSPGQYFLVLTARDGSRAVQPFSRL